MATSSVLAAGIRDTGGDRLRVPVESWLRVMQEEYLRDFIRGGGSTVKVISGAPETLESAARSLEAMAADSGYLHVHLNPARLDPDGRKPDVHRIERTFFALTRDVDWKRLAADEARAFLDARGITVAPGRALNDLDGIAEDNGRTSADLLNEYQRDFATPLLRNRWLDIEFRTALTALGRAQLLPDAVTPTTEEVLLNWFAGRALPGGAAALKRIQIYGRIDRSNARHMLDSFCRWLPRTGRSGLVAVLDFRPYEHKRKTLTQRRNETNARVREAVARGASNEELAAIMADAEREPPVSYSQKAYMEMLQTLRRFIDDVDRFERFCLIVLTSPSFYDEASERNYFNYDALQTRIGLEVHDLGRADPAASLVHLADAADEADAAGMAAREDGA